MAQRHFSSFVLLLFPLVPFNHLSSFLTMQIKPLDNETHRQHFETYRQHFGSICNVLVDPEDEEKAHALCCIDISNLHISCFCNHPHTPSSNAQSNLHLLCRYPQWTHTSDSTLLLSTTPGAATLLKSPIFFRIATQCVILPDVLS